MRIILLLILLLFSSLITIAENNLDSMLRVLTKGKNIEEQFDTIFHTVQKYNSEKLHTRLFYSRALVDIANESGDSDLIGKALYSLAYSYEIIGQLDMGIKSCFEALKYLKKTNNKYLIGMTYNEIGLIYSASNSTVELQRAIDYFNKFLIIQKERQDTAEIAGAYSNIGLIYIYLSNGDSAYYYSNLALKLRLKINQKRAIPISYGNVGMSLYFLNKKDSALVYYKKAEQIYLKSNNLYGLNETYRNYISFYLDSKDTEKAKIYVDKYFEAAKKINSRQITKTAYLGKYEYYKLIGDNEKALSNFEIYSAYSDTLNDEKIKDRIANMEAVYKLDEKEKKIALLKEKEKLAQQEKINRKQRFTFLMVVAAMMVIILLIIVLSVVRKRRQESIMHDMEHRAFEKEKALAQSELEKSQLKEHELSTLLEYKSKQLTSHALNMMKKNQFLQEVENDVSEISKNSSEEVKNQLHKLNRSIRRMNKSDKDWELFKNYFEEVNQGFYSRLAKKYQGLSPNDYKLLALIKLNMNIKETASVLNISPDSVKTARYRLRKKLHMTQEEDLYEFVSKV